MAHRPTLRHIEIWNASIGILRPAQNRQYHWNQPPGSASNAQVTMVFSPTYGQTGCAGLPKRSPLDTDVNHSLGSPAAAHLSWKMPEHETPISSISLG